MEDKKPAKAPLAFKLAIASIIGLETGFSIFGLLIFIVSLFDRPSSLWWVSLIIGIPAVLVGGFILTMFKYEDKITEGEQDYVPIGERLKPVQPKTLEEIIENPRDQKNVNWDLVDRMYPKDKDHGDNKKKES